jgi:hypothetical protein
MYILKSIRKDGFFDALFDLFKEKKFSSLRRDKKLFSELKKVKNGRNPSKFRKTVFHKQILTFHCPFFEILSKSLVPNPDPHQNVMDLPH